MNESKDVFAVVAMVAGRYEGHWLGVTRKDNVTDWGLPGGKVEPGETPEQAMHRELLEETNIKASELIFVCDDEHDGRIVRTFMVTKWSLADIECSNKEEGLVGWQSEATLSAGTFGEFNRRRFNEIHKKPVAPAETVAVTVNNEIEPNAEQHQAAQDVCEYIVCRDEGDGLPKSMADISAIAWLLAAREAPLRKEIEELKAFKEEIENMTGEEAMFSIDKEHQKREQSRLTDIRELRRFLRDEIRPIIEQRCRETGRIEDLRSLDAALINTNYADIVEEDKARPRASAKKSPP